jgi:dimethylargininase
VRIAITRAVSPALAKCELSYIDRQPINAVRAAAQHDAYERRLAAHGCKVIRIAEAPDMPDGVFVEDAAVVLDDLAIITRPGAISRRAETASVSAALERFRPLRTIEAPATLDGGDVLAIDGKLYIGMSQRTNMAAIRQINAVPSPAASRHPLPRERAAANSEPSPLGEGGPKGRVRGVPVRFQNCLHLKSAVTLIGERTLLMNPQWVDAGQFGDFEVIPVDDKEPFGANALRLDDILLYSASYPRTRRLLESRGFHVETLDLFELEKAEAGVTCCSLIFSE